MRLDQPLPRCTSCGERMRPVGSKFADYPGSRAKGFGGQCKACSFAPNRSEQILANSARHFDAAEAVVVAMVERRFEGEARLQILQQLGLAS